MQDVINQLTNGVGIGLVYFLIAVGLTIILGVENFVNFAHGALFMVGAYIAYEISYGAIGFWLALIVAPVLIGGLSFGVERLVLRRMYGWSHEYQIIATFGLALIIKELVTMIWGTYSHVVSTPAGLGGAITLAGVHIPIYRTFVIGVTLALAALLWLGLEKTRYGSILRAGSESTEMISALGINIHRVFALTFMLGSALAALGGVLGAPLQSISPDTGNTIIGLAFVVVVVGGMGSFGGALLGAILIGLVQALALLFWPAGSAIAPFIFMAAILITRPDGLLGKLNAPPA